MQKNTPGKGGPKGKIRQGRRIKKEKKETHRRRRRILTIEKERKKKLKRKKKEGTGNDLVLSFHHQDIPWREQSELEKLLPPCSRPPRFLED